MSSMTLSLALLLLRWSRKISMDVSTPTSSTSASTHILDLPDAWWKFLLHHLSSDQDGPASIASLSGTCTAIHGKSGHLLASSYIKTQELVISSPEDSFWLWLAKWGHRILSLTITITPYSGTHEDPHQEQQLWKGPLRSLSEVYDLELTVAMPRIASCDHPFVRQWLETHGPMITELHASLDTEDASCLPVAEFVGLAPHHCKSLVLKPVLKYGLADDFERGMLKGFHALSALSHLTSLDIGDFYNLSDEDPFGNLAALSGLRDLRCDITVDDDPTPLLALTSLTSLALDVFHIQREEGEEHGHVSFTSLWPFTVLQHLEVLDVDICCCSYTSLDGLAGLSRLNQVTLQCEQLVSMQGMGTGITHLCLLKAGSLRSIDGIEEAVALQSLHLLDCKLGSLRPLAALRCLKTVELVADLGEGVEGLTSLEGLEGSSSCLQRLWLAGWVCLRSLDGLEKFQALEEFSVEECGVTSLRPLSQVGRCFQILKVCKCRDVVETVLELPLMEPDSAVKVSESNVRELMLAGGVVVMATEVEG